MLGKRSSFKFQPQAVTSRQRALRRPLRNDAPEVPLRRSWADPIGRSERTDFSQQEGVFGDYSPPPFRPRVDVVDDGRHLRITAELPGMLGEELEVSVGQGSLVIAGEKRVDATSQEEGCLLTERAYGAFKRVIPLPIEVDPEGAEATYERGVLSVCIPKRDDEARSSGSAWSANRALTTAG